MSETGPEGPYVYQPYGHQDKEHWQAGRIYGVGGVSELTTIDGLTKQEAQAIYWVLSNPALVAGGIEELVKAVVNTIEYLDWLDGALVESDADMKLEKCDAPSSVADTLRDRLIKMGVKP